MYQRSPIRVAHQERRRFELRPGESAAEPFGITADLKAAGISHYVIFPLFFTGGHVNAASFATDRAGGFQATEIEFIERLVPALSRVMEIKGLQRSRQELLRIYVGKLPAERILDGHIRRGNVVAMNAAILLCDLRGSTQMAVELDEEAFVRLLNRYFDCVVPAVTAHGGEVLKFIGDAVLAIFELPARPGDCAHCDRALAVADAIFASLRELNAAGPAAVSPPGHPNGEHRSAQHEGSPVDPLEVTIALHEGRVAFGNIGSVERQDFTVIGQDVNLVARLGTLAAQLGEPLLLSDRVAARYPVGLRKVGEFPSRVSAICRASTRGWRRPVRPRRTGAIRAQPGARSRLAVAAQDRFPALRPPDTCVRCTATGFRISPVFRERKRPRFPIMHRHAAAGRAYLAAVPHCAGWQRDVLPRMLVYNDGYQKTRGHLCDRDSSRGVGDSSPDDPSPERNLPC